MESNWFTKHFPEFSQKIMDCDQLSNDDKNSFFSLFSSLNDDEDTVKDAAIQHFSKNKFLGKRKIIKPNESLSHMHKWKHIESIAKRLIPSGISFFQSWKNSFMSGDVKLQNEYFNEIVNLLKENYILQSKEINPVVIWFFLHASSFKPFSSANIRQMPCRLGLRDLDHQNYLPISFNLTGSIEMNYPTAFDADLYEYWEPGGKTKPRNECKGESGFDEVVVNGAINKVWDYAQSP